MSALSPLAVALIDAASTLNSALEGDAREDAEARTGLLLDAATVVADAENPLLADSLARLAFEVAREALPEGDRPM